MIFFYKIVSCELFDTNLYYKYIKIYRLKEYYKLKILWFHNSNLCEQNDSKEFRYIRWQNWYLFILIPENNLKFQMIIKLFWIVCLRLN